MNVRSSYRYFISARFVPVHENSEMKKKKGKNDVIVFELDMH